MPQGQHTQLLCNLSASRDISCYFVCIARLASKHTFCCGQFESQINGSFSATYSAIIRYITHYGTIAISDCHSYNGKLIRAAVP